MDMKGRVERCEGAVGAVGEVKELTGFAKLLKVMSEADMYRCANIYHLRKVATDERRVELEAEEAAICLSYGYDMIKEKMIQ